MRKMTKFAKSSGNIQNRSRGKFSEYFDFGAVQTSVNLVDVEKCSNFKEMRTYVRTYARTTYYVHLLFLVHIVEQYYTYSHTIVASTSVLATIGFDANENEPSKLCR